MNGKILIVDDEERIRYVLSCLLEEKGYRVETAADGRDAIETAAAFDPDLILMDLEMPEMGGLESFRELKNKGYAGKVIILTAYGTIPSAVEAMKLGAYDYLAKPFANDELLIVIERALQQDKIERELAEARDRLKERFSIEGIITRNAGMCRLLDVIKRIGPMDSPVVITGESGTGKELFANAVHQHSLRKDGPFIAVNCGALPQNIVESELFGYRKGAFTGAVSNKSGLVERADGGTLFLDEVAEMGPDVQVKLLRFAQSGEFIPVGGTEVQRVDVRLIAASNRDLEAAIDDGRFRSDLYYRLNVAAIRIPPLRERIEDLPLLVDHFLRKYGTKAGKDGYRFSNETMELLQMHPWPGNVRELENAVYSALVMANSSPIGLEALPLSITRKQPGLPISTGGGTLHEIVASHREAVERRMIVETLRECRGNQSEAARRLGIGRNTLMRKMKSCRIESPRASNRED
jgi:two-component system response regulator AtoC